MGFRDGGPTIFAMVKGGKGVDDIVGLVLSAWKSSGAYEVSLERWKKEGKKGSQDASRSGERVYAFDHF